MSSTLEFIDKSFKKSFDLSKIKDFLTNYVSYKLNYVQGIIKLYDVRYSLN